MIYVSAHEEGTQFSFAILRASRSAPFVGVLIKCRRETAKRGKKKRREIRVRADPVSEHELL